MNYSFLAPDATATAKAVDSDRSASHLSAALCIVTKRCKIVMLCKQKSNRTMGATVKQFIDVNIGLSMSILFPMPPNGGLNFFGRGII